MGLYRALIKLRLHISLLRASLKLMEKALTPSRFAPLPTWLRRLASLFRGELIVSDNPRRPASCCVRRHDRLQNRGGLLAATFGFPVREFSSENRELYYLLVTGIASSLRSSQ